MYIYTVGQIDKCDPTKPQFKIFPLHLTFGSLSLQYVPLKHRWFSVML